MQPAGVCGLTRRQFGARIAANAIARLEWPSRSGPSSHPGTRGLTAKRVARESSRAEARDERFAADADPVDRGSSDKRWRRARWL
jgi:hypothetical protein